MIPEEELRHLVNTIGAEKYSRPAYDKDAYRIPTKKRDAERDDAVQKSQRLFLTFLAEDPSLLSETEYLLRLLSFITEFLRYALFIFRNTL